MKSQWVLLCISLFSRWFLGQFRALPVNFSLPPSRGREEAKWQNSVISSQLRLMVYFHLGKIKAIHLANPRVIVQTVLLLFFSVFIFSMPYKVINISY